MKSYKEFILDVSEAVGDPLTSKNVIPLDQTTEKNLRSTMTPAGPPPMQSSSKKKKPPEDKISTFLKRMNRNTILSPL